MTERARYVIVFFMKSRKGYHQKNCTYFDNLDYTDVKLYLNTEVYPYENMILNFKNRLFTSVTSGFGLSYVYGISKSLFKEAV